MKVSFAQGPQNSPARNNQMILCFPVIAPANIKATQVTNKGLERQL